MRPWGQQIPVGDLSPVIRINCQVAFALHSSLMGSGMHNSNHIHTTSLSNPLATRGERITSACVTGGITGSVVRQYNSQGTTRTFLTSSLTIALHTYTSNIYLILLHIGCTLHASIHTLSRSLTFIYSLASNIYTALTPGLPQAGGRGESVNLLHMRI